MNFFPTNDCPLLESCQLYIITKYKDSNSCKIEAVIQRYSVKKVFLKDVILKTPAVAASGEIKTKFLKLATLQFQLFLNIYT